MVVKQFSLLVVFLCSYFTYGQTTDLSIAIEAQDLNGSAISQVDIYEDFQYLITISNSGNAASDATITIDFDDDLTILSSNSQNNNNGASNVSSIDIIANILNGSVASLPSNSSVELLVLVTAPTNLGGIAANGIINPPSGTTDVNPSNNQSIISIDVLDIVIDFTVSHIQINPSPGNTITSWGDEVTYQFTITNNSAIDFPIDAISGKLILESPFQNGQPFAEFISLDCITSTNGTMCPEISNINSFSETVVTPNISTAPSIFNFFNGFEVTSGGSITFEMVYRYTNFTCSSDPMPINVGSFVEITLGHSNVSSNLSNGVTTNLLNADLCPETDICIETVQVDPDPSEDLIYGQNITFETTLSNNGPSAAPIRFFFQNLVPFLNWDIISVNCISTIGPVSCSDFTISTNELLWVSNDFILQPNTTIIIETVVQYFEPPCSSNPDFVEAALRSATNILDAQLVDTNPDNNIHDFSIELPAIEPCDTNEQYDLQVTKTQINPELPVGSNSQNTAQWGEIIYEVTISNNSNSDESIEVLDHMPVPSPTSVPITGTLTNLECTNTTGTATCLPIENVNIGITHDGITQDGSFDTFWEILPSDNWLLPANSSVTFTVTVDWLPECSSQPMIGQNIVRVNYINRYDTNPSNNTASATTFFAPCIDLVVQTYPEFTQVDTGQNFNWIVDISNSTTSSQATNVIFNNMLDSAFAIAGTPTCTISSGNATCISSFNVSGNSISGIIPDMEAGSTVSISIPVTAPNFGGAFNNTAEAIPNAANNEELTPETNISINSVQVLSPSLDKVFSPDTIFEVAESELIFTVFNIASNPTQNNIAFTDNLPVGVTLSASPDWIMSNGCTATFAGNIGDDFVGVTDLVFPDGVASCTFSVMVTSSNQGTYINNFQNFTNTNNIDASQTSATLNVIIDNSNVDIEITKTVEPTEVVLGEEVVFTITATNIGTDTATGIDIIDQLPLGYEYISSNTTIGSFDDSTMVWTITNLLPGESAILTLTAITTSSNDLLNIAFLDGLNEIDRDPSNNEDSALVQISNCLTIPQGISPNDDGRNDVLLIPCIEDYPNNTIKIFNRYGAQVYEANNYLNSWDGRSNMGVLSSSKLLPIGTYFYILEVEGFSEPFQGYIYLNY